MARKRQNWPSTCLNEILAFGWLWEEMWKNCRAMCTGRCIERLECHLFRSSELESRSEFPKAYRPAAASAFLRHAPSTIHHQPAYDDDGTISLSLRLPGTKDINHWELFRSEIMWFYRPRASKFQKDSILIFLMHLPRKSFSPLSRHAICNFGSVMLSSPKSGASELCQKVVLDVVWIGWPPKTPIFSSKQIRDCYCHVMTRLAD